LKLALNGGILSFRWS